MTAWERLPLTAAVLRHYARVRGDAALAAARVVLAVHVAGTGGAPLAAAAAATGATYSEHPNTPLGAKHNAGLAAGRGAHPATDAVVVVGSDDLLPAAYFPAIAARLRGGRSHVVGLADLGVVDVGAWTAAYSRGYRGGANPVASTVGLGRAYSAAVLDGLAHRGGLWEPPLRRGLDQSAARRLLTGLPAVVWCAAVLEGGVGAGGLAGVDVKTGGAGGVNLWAYATLVGAGGDGPGDRLRPFGAVDVDGLVRGVGGDAAVVDLRAVRAELAELAGGGGGRGGGGTRRPRGGVGPRRRAQSVTRPRVGGGGCAGLPGSGAQGVPAAPVGDAPRRRARGRCRGAARAAVVRGGRRPRRGGGGGGAPACHHACDRRGPPARGRGGRATADQFFFSGEGGAHRPPWRLPAWQPRRRARRGGRAPAVRAACAGRAPPGRSTLGAPAPQRRSTRSCVAHTGLGGAGRGGGPRATAARSTRFVGVAGPPLRLGACGPCTRAGGGCRWRGCGAGPADGSALRPVRVGCSGWGRGGGRWLACLPRAAGHAQVADTTVPTTPRAPVRPRLCTRGRGLAPCGAGGDSPPTLPTDRGPQLPIAAAADAPRRRPAAARLCSPAVGLPACAGDALAA
ncbi:hypothetical protein BU14_0572s0002 [Porphyra umbilicalis]|uniref:Uncharacterized protein n=1 Tax=Porphyra umbilicalis TaxID=2786 RepID=A0A1X6NS96_PORUM|nr:hypothetical protein BU14_0572s0002 [Porphyra umbilicalis]|eukprot:OSX71253.1 hypothetical protein BU14_0572s0002 [Porphyra umbilicalis]